MNGKANLSWVIAVLAMGATALLLTPEAAVAQEMAPGIMETETSRVKDYGRPGYPRVTVYIWGNANSGVWTVEEGTDLLEYVSVAAEVDFTQNPETRVKNILRLYRKGQGTDEPAFEASLSDIFSRQTTYPTLQNGDVLVIETIQRRAFFYRFREAIQIAGTLASVVSLGFIIWDR